jgi:hypothetical protein
MTRPRGFEKPHTFRRSSTGSLGKGWKVSIGASASGEDIAGEAEGSVAGDVLGPRARLRFAAS